MKCGKGDTYTIIKEENNVCDIKFQSGNIIQGLEWERVRKARVLDKNKK